jgi:hypothetical protein
MYSRQLGEERERWARMPLSATPSSQGGGIDEKGGRSGVRNRQGLRRRLAVDGGGKGDFAVRMNTLPKFVASSSLTEPLPWDGTLLKGELADEVAALKEQPGQDILIYVPAAAP